MAEITDEALNAAVKAVERNMRKKRMTTMVEDIRAALHAAAPYLEPKWQSMETAPKGAEVVLLCAPGAFGTQWVGAGWYDEEHAGWWEVNTHYSDAQDGQIHNPTGWCRLPTPQEGGKE